MDCFKKILFPKTSAAEKQPGQVIPMPAPPASAQPVPSTLPKPPNAGELEIDVYHGDAPIDFKKMRAEGRVKRVYVKVSEYHVDTTFASRTRAAQAEGFPVGGYHFMRATLDGRAQGEMFIKAIKDAGIKFELPPCLDWESGSAMGMSSEHQQKVADDFIAVVEAAFGVTVEIYGGESFLRELKLPAKYARHPLWLAHYQTTFSHLHIPAPWTRIQGWQYTDAETVAGLPPGRHVDASWVYYNA